MNGTDKRLQNARLDALRRDRSGHRFDDAILDEAPDTAPQQLTPNDVAAGNPNGSEKRGGSEYAKLAGLVLHLKQYYTLAFLRRQAQLTVPSKNNDKEIGDAAFRHSRSYVDAIVSSSRPNCRLRRAHVGN
jgi:hypothetical protein